MPQFQITTQAPLIAFISIFFLLGGTLFLLFGFGVVRSGTGEGITIIIQKGQSTIITGVVGIILGVLGFSGVISIPESPLTTPTSTAAGVVSTPTVLPIPTTNTSRSTPIPTATIDADPTVYDNFNNPTFDKSYNQSQWKASTISTNQIFQQDGILIMTGNV